MRYPFDNNSRISKGAKVSVIHDADGRIVFQVSRVNLKMNPGETTREWLQREKAATVERASVLVKLLNSACAMGAASDKHDEQLWLAGIDRGED